MRIYANGTISNGEESNFILTDLCFATEACEDTTMRGNDCLILSGETCECCVKGESWDARMKGVDVLYGDDEFDDYSDFLVNGKKYTAQEILEIILKKEMKLRNIEGYIELTEETYVKVDSITIVDGKGEIEIPSALLNENIDVFS